MSSENTLKLMLEYQKKREPTMFFRLLAKYDALLVSYARQLMKIDEPLRGLELQEVYQTAVIGLSEMIDRVKPTLPPVMLPAAIRGKVRAAIRRIYRHRYKDWNKVISSDAWEGLQDSKALDKEVQDKGYTEAVNRVDCQTLMSLAKLSEEEVRCVLSSVGLRLSQREVAEKYGLTVHVARYRIERGLLKLRELRMKYPEKL